MLGISIHVDKIVVRKAFSGCGVYSLKTTDTFSDSAKSLTFDCLCAIDICQNFAFGDIVVDHIGWVSVIFVTFQSHSI